MTTTKGQPSERPKEPGGRRPRRYRATHRARRAEAQALPGKASRALGGGQKRYREQHRDRIREKNRRYFKANQERILARQQRYREAHREELREKQRRYRESRREELREKQQAIVMPVVGSW